MSTAFIRELLTHMDVRPKPLFQGDVDSDDDAEHDNDHHAAADANADETMATQGQEDSGEYDAMPTQGPEGSGEVNLAPSPGLLELEGYVDKREPWVEGEKGEKVCRSGMVTFRSLIKNSVLGFRWRIIPTPSLASSRTEV
jgi:hypothetical protein